MPQILQIFRQDYRLKQLIIAAALCGAFSCSLNSRWFKFGLRKNLCVKVWHDLADVQLEEFDRFCNLATLQYLFCGGTEVRLDRDHALNQAFQIARINVWWLLEDAPDNTFVQVCHVCRAEWRMERQRLVQDAAKRPDITLTVIRLVIPDLRTSIIGSACLGV